MLKHNTDKSLPELIKQRITHYFLENQLSNEDMVQIIEHIGGYLNLKSRSQYAKDFGISYNGAKKHRQNIKLFGSTFILDNE